MRVMCEILCNNGLQLSNICLNTHYNSLLVKNIRHLRICEPQGASAFLYKNRYIILI